MPAKSITDRLHSSLKLESMPSDELIDDEEILTYEQALGASIPIWYFQFLQEYGNYVQCGVFDGLRHRGEIYIFGWSDSRDYFFDMREGYEDFFHQRMPIGNDLGNRVLYYSARPGEEGIHVSWNRPEDDYFPYLAPNLEALLFDGQGLAEYIDQSAK